MRERKKRGRSLSKFQYRLVGGAAGDTLGFTVEFMSGGSIIAAIAIEKYSSDGIRNRKKDAFDTMTEALQKKLQRSKPMKNAGAPTWQHGNTN